MERREKKTRKMKEKREKEKEAKERVAKLENGREVKRKCVRKKEGAGEEKAIKWVLRRVMGE